MSVRKSAFLIILSSRVDGVIWLGFMHAMDLLTNSKEEDDEEDAH